MEKVRIYQRDIGHYVEIIKGKDHVIYGRLRAIYPDHVYLQPTATVNVREVVREVGRKSALEIVEGNSYLIIELMKNKPETVRREDMRSIARFESSFSRLMGINSNYLP